MKVFALTWLALSLSFFPLYSQKTMSNDSVPAEARVEISTDMGTIVCKLYNETPLHRDNFLKLARTGFYDSLLFHRVIEGFMIQGGDPSSKTAEAGRMLGAGDVGYKVAAELKPELFHKRGALAAARDGNPEKASSGCQFYIVQGKKYSESDLKMLESRMGTTFSAEKKEAYINAGGTPFLDMNYTVFGEVLSGMDVVDQIARQQKDGNDRPLSDIRMKVKVIE